MLPMLEQHPSDTVFMMRLALTPSSPGISGSNLQSPAAAEHVVSCTRNDCPFQALNRFGNSKGASCLVSTVDEQFLFSASCISLLPWPLHFEQSSSCVGIF